MKKLLTLVLALFVSPAVFGQGSVVFDQQSSTDESIPFYGQGGAIQDALLPWGQSFTPSLSSVGFIRLKLVDGNTDDGLGATVYLNLRSGSVSGPVIGVTAPVSMPSSFRGVTEFTFQDPVSLTPTATYYFEPVVASGGPWNIVGGPLNYSGGSFYNDGSAVPQSDLWFREGMVVPEPGTFGLIILAGGAYLWQWLSKTYEDS